MAKTDLTSELTATESRRLAVCEKIVTDNMDRVRAVAEALLEIKDGRLYRKTHTRFEDYVNEKWGLSKQYVYRIMGKVGSPKQKPLAPPVAPAEFSFDDPPESEAGEAEEDGQEECQDGLEKSTEVYFYTPDCQNGEGGVSAENAQTSEKKKPQDVDVYTDSFGNPVPDELIPVFEQGKDLEGRAKDLRSFVKWVSQYDTGGEFETVGTWLHVQSFVGFLENAQDALKHSVPYALCPYCRATKTVCKACKSRGWVTKRIYLMSPMEVRQ